MDRRCWLITRAFRANRESMFAWRSSLLGRRTHSARDRAPLNGLFRREINLLDGSSIMAFTFLGGRLLPPIRVLLPEADRKELGALVVLYPSIGERTERHLPVLQRVHGGEQMRQR